MEKQELRLFLKSGEIIGKTFKSNLGILQDDCLRAILFIVHLAQAVSPYRQDHLLEHNYGKIFEEKETTKKNLHTDHTYAKSGRKMPLGNSY